MTRTLSMPEPTREERPALPRTSSEQTLHTASGPVTFRYVSSAFVQEQIALRDARRESERPNSRSTGLSAEVLRPQLPELHRPQPPVLPSEPRRQEQGSAPKKAEDLRSTNVRKPRHTVSKPASRLSSEHIDPREDTYRIKKHRDGGAKDKRSEGSKSKEPTYKKLAGAALGIATALAADTLRESQQRSERPSPSDRDSARNRRESSVGRNDRPTGKTVGFAKDIVERVINLRPVDWLQEAKDAKVAKVRAETQTREQIDRDDRDAAHNALKGARGQLAYAIKMLKEVKNQREGEVEEAQQRHEQVNSRRYSSREREPARKALSAAMGRLRDAERDLEEALELDEDTGRGRTTQPYAASSAVSASSNGPRSQVQRAESKPEPKPETKRKPYHAYVEDASDEDLV